MFQSSHLISPEKHIILHKLVMEFCSSLTVIDMAISVCVYHALVAREKGPPVLHIISDDSCSSHVLLCEIMGHLEVATYALFETQRVQLC